MKDFLLPVKEISKWAGCVCWHVSDSRVTVQTPAAYLYEQEKATATKSPEEFLKASSVPEVGTEAGTNPG